MANEFQYIKKCHLLTITHKPKPSEFTYTISNQPISRVNSHPYLGVTIDAKLSWNKHIYTRHSIQICQDTWSTQTNPISRQTESKGGSLQYASTVEPLMNDHPHQRPSLSYDHISCDGQWFLFVNESLTNDHPSYTTTPMSPLCDSEGGRIRGVLL